MSNFLSTQPYKGTRDFYPEDYRVRHWMFEKLRATLKTFGYQEYDGPMIEPFELYASKTSEEIVNQQLYWMLDRAERKLAIRPEMTPTLARMVAAKINEIPRPIRWFSIPNLWRYEKPQRGRLREHWQLNVDLFGGAERGSEDLEIAQVMVAVMQGFGAKQGFEIRLNHRGITDFFFQKVLKLSETQIQPVGRLLDAAAKMGIPAFEASLKDQSLNESQIGTLTDLFRPEASKKIQTLLWQNEHFQELQKFLEKLDKLGISQFFRYDPTIMRGFMYYTGLVFEVYDLHPENTRALFGGGRYDNLVGSFGKHSLSGIGFGMGDVTLRNFLETHQLLPDLNRARGVYVAHLFPEQQMAVLALAQELRSQVGAQGIPVLTALEDAKPKKIFPTAEKLGCEFVVFVGPDEIAKGEFPIKNLITGNQQTLSATKIAEELLR